MIGKDLFLICWLLFCPIDSVLCLTEALQFYEVPFVNSWAWAIGVLFRKISPVPMCSRLFPTFFSISFSVSGFMWRSLIHLDLSFVQGDKNVPPGDPVHIQLLNPDPITDANKSLQTGAWYSCLLRGSASAWQIQTWMLTAIHWAGHRVPDGGARERTQGAEGVCSPIGGTTISTNQTPYPELLETKPPTKEYTLSDP